MESLLTSALCFLGGENRLIVLFYIVDINLKEIALEMVFMVVARIRRLAVGNLVFEYEFSRAHLCHYICCVMGLFLWFLFGSLLMNVIGQCLSNTQRD